MSARYFSRRAAPRLVSESRLKWKVKSARGFAPVFAYGSLLAVSAGFAAAQTAPPIAPPDTTRKVSPFPTGVIPLPQGAPPTGLQAPLPAPTLPPGTGEKPLRQSPDLRGLNSYLQSKPLDINDAVAIALATSRNFANAVSALYRAQGRTSEARAALVPTFGIGANITEFDAPTTANLGAVGGGTSGATGGAASAPFVIVNQFNPVITATFDLPLDIAGSLRAAASQAQFQEVAAKIDINRVRNQIVLDVKSAFYSALRAQAQVVVAQDNLNNSLGRLSDANKNYAAGTAPRFDIITAQSDVANAQQGLINAKAQVSLALASLKNTIGLNVRTPLSLTSDGAVENPPGVAPPTVPPIGPDGRPTDSLGAPGTPPAPTPNAPVTTPPPLLAPPINTDQAAPKDPTGKSQSAAPPTQNLVTDTLDLGPEFDAVFREALASRPEILEGDAQIAAAQKGVVFARRSELPSFGVSLGYTESPNAAGFTRFNQFAATLNVNIPIFDGGLSRARVQEARADVATAQTNRRNAEDQVGLEVQQAYIALVQGRDRVQVTNVGLSQAREAFRLARVRYNAGVSQQAGISPELELINAQTSLAQAESNQVNAIYDYNLARAQLDKATGRYSYVPLGGGYASPPPPNVTGRPAPDKKPDGKEKK